MATKRQLVSIKAIISPFVIVKATKNQLGWAKATKSQ